MPKNERRGPPACHIVRGRNLRWGMTLSFNFRLPKIKFKIDRPHVPPAGPGKPNEISWPPRIPAAKSGNRPLGAHGPNSDLNEFVLNFCPTPKRSPPSRLSTPHPSGFPPRIRNFTLGVFSIGNLAVDVSAPCVSSLFVPAHSFVFFPYSLPPVPKNESQRSVYPVLF